MLRFSAWIRRQRWLKAVYQHAPAALRGKVSMALAAGSNASFGNLPKSATDTEAFQPAAPRDSARATYGDCAGVNVFAYLRGQFGLGESARMYSRALLDIGYPVALHNVDIDLPHACKDHSLDAFMSEDAPYPVNLICVNPNSFEATLKVIGDARSRGRYVIASWFWELEQIPDEWLPVLDHVDEIMVATRFIEDAFRRATDKPVLRVPLPLGDVVDSGLTRSDFGLPQDKFLFLCTFDFNGWVSRKNPEAVLNAFRRAFPPGRDDVCLLVKSSNGHRHPEKLMALMQAAGEDPRILVRDDVIEREHVHALQRCADAYVSLHRAEGFGMGLAECMRLGKPVIGTGWSGNVDFMNHDNSCLVNYRLVPVAKDDYVGAEKGARWAEADLDHAAESMRRLVDEPGFAARIGAQASRDMRDHNSPAGAAHIIAQRLGRLAAGRAPADAAGPITNQKARA